MASPMIGYCKNCQWYICAQAADLRQNTSHFSELDAICEMLPLVAEEIIASSYPFCSTISFRRSQPRVVTSPIHREDEYTIFSFPCIPQQTEMNLPLIVQSRTEFEHTCRASRQRELLFVIQCQRGTRHGTISQFRTGNSS